MKLQGRIFKTLSLSPVLFSFVSATTNISRINLSQSLGILKLESRSTLRRSGGHCIIAVFQEDSSGAQAQSCSTDHRSHNIVNQ